MSDHGGGEVGWYSAALFQLFPCKMRPSRCVNANKWGPTAGCERCADPPDTPAEGNSIIWDLGGNERIRPGTTGFLLTRAKDSSVRRNTTEALMRCCPKRRVDMSDWLLERQTDRQTAGGQWPQAQQRAAQGLGRYRWKTENNSHTNLAGNFVLFASAGIFDTASCSFTGNDWVTYAGMTWSKQRAVTTPTPL